MKAFFSKIWAWIIAHKVVSIIIAAAVAVSATLGVVLPIALHNHKFADEWTHDADNHWHDATCIHKDEKADLAAHVYDNACDTKCNICEAAREITHAYQTELTAGDTTHWYACSVCGDKKDETAHVFDKTIASSDYLKAAATSTTKAVYYKSCECGKASDTETFETDKLPVNLEISDISKTYDGTPVSEPEITFDGVGGEMFEYFQAGTKLEGKPTNAGTYTVKVTIYETETHVSETVEREFTIAKKVLSNMKASIAYDGSTTFGEMTLAHDGIVSGDVIIADIDVTNKNVGVYTGTDAVFAILDALGHGAANYEIDAQTTEVTVTPKTLNYLEITKVYDGEGVLAYELGTEHGVVAGDTVLFYCDEAPDYIVGTYNLIPYDDPTSIDDPGADDRALLAGADKANYKFAERIEGKYKLCATITVTKRAVWATDVVFTYDGYSAWYGEESPNQITFQNVANGETIDYSYVIWKFESKNTTAKLTSVEFTDDYDGGSNYEIDFSKCTASIVKRAVWAENVKFTYDGENSFYGDYATSEIVFQNVVTGETINACDIVFKFDNKDVGSGLIAVGYDDGITGNYEFDLSKCTASIVKRAIWIENAEFAYGACTNFCGDEYDIGYFDIKNLVAGEEQNIQQDITWRFENANVGATLVAVDLMEEYHPNYTIDFSKCTASIVKRAIWAENVEFTYNGYRIWTGEESPYQITFQNVANGETIDSSFVVWTFSAKTAGSKLASVSFMNEDDGRSNYTIDFAKCTASIEKKIIWTTGAEFVYTGFDNFYGDEAKNTVTFYGLVNGDVLDAGDVWFKFDGSNTDNVLIGVYFDGAGNDITDNYEFDITGCDAEIVPAQLKFNLFVTDKEYDGHTVYPNIINLPDWFNRDTATITIDYKLSSESEDHYGMNNNPVAPGTYTVRVGIDETKNYTSYIARAEFTISKKALTLNLTYVYDSGAPITKLTAENGVAGNEVLFLELCYWQDYDKVGTYKLTDKIDSEPAGDHNLEGVSLFGDTKDYYTFTYDQDGYVGTFTLAPFVLDIPDNFVIEKTQDGTNYVTFTIFASNGYTLNRDVTVKIPVYLSLDDSPVTKYGTYTTQSGDPETEIYFGTPEFFINTVNQVNAFALPEKFENEPVTVHIFDDRTLFIQMYSPTGEQVDADGLMKYRVTVAQGALRVGDEVVAYSQTTGGKYSTVKIAGIEYVKTGEAVDFVNGTDWNEVYIYVENGPESLAPGSVVVLAHTDAELVYSDSIYVQLTVDSAQTMNLGNGFYISFINNRQYANYQCKPNEILGAESIAPGESAYVLIRLYNSRYYAADMELLITPGVMPANKFIGTATILSPIEAEEKVENGSLHMVVENVDLVANQPTVIELTNDEFVDDIYRFVFNGVSASNVKIYESDGTEIDAEYHSTGTNMLNFVLTSSGEVFTLAEGESMYIVIIPDSDTDSFKFTAF